MDKSFINAANAAASGDTSSPSSRALTITAAWEDVLASGLKFNFELLDLLCKRKEKNPRTRIIITDDTTRKETIDDMIMLAIDAGQQAGYDLSALTQFEFINKTNLLLLTGLSQIDVDIAFDCTKISTQNHAVQIGNNFKLDHLDYVHPRHEILVRSNFSTTPVSMNRLSCLIDGLSETRADAGYVPPAPH